MKLNEDKCHLLVSGHKYENLWVKMGHEKNWESSKQISPGMEIRRIFNFDDYVFSLCKKPGKTNIVNEIISSISESL